MLSTRTIFYRLRFWQQYLASQGYGIIFCYDRYYNKGAALSRVVDQLKKHVSFSSRRFLLISAGDDVPDSSMTNGDLRFPFDADSRPGVPDLPLNVFFAGSVVPFGAGIGKPELRLALLANTETVDAEEPSIQGIMQGVLTLVMRALVSLSLVDSQL